MIEQTLSYVAESKSPVDGSSFKKLSKEYGAIKKAETGSDDPNLDLTGSMLTSLEFKVSGDKIELGVYGSDAGKADGHNNFSGKSKLPRRQFLPDKGEAFESSIMQLVSDTVAAYKADNATLKPKQLEAIDSKAGLYDYLQEVLGDYSRAELKRLVLSSELSVALDEFDLLGLL